MKKIILGFILGFLFYLIASQTIFEIRLNIYAHRYKPLITIYYHYPKDWFKDRAWDFWDSSGGHTYWKKVK